MPTEIPTFTCQNRIPEDDDFTIFFPVDEEKNWRTFCNGWIAANSFMSKIYQIPAGGNKLVNQSEKEIFSVAETIKLTEEESETSKIGRALICLCSRGQLVSMTVRILHKEKSGSRTENAARKRETATEECKFELPEGSKNFFKLETSKAFGDYTEIAAKLSNRLTFTDAGSLPPKGILVIAGQTNCGKSSIVRQLIWTLIEQLVKKKQKRTPHILTYEDPAECPLVSSSLNPSQPSCMNLAWELLKSWNIDFTQREKGRDTSGLLEVLTDALRQTPQIVYVGEVRTLEEWGPIFDFAGTGHFVIATTHASSITETMSRMLMAVNADKPATKGYFAQRIFALVHLERINVIEGEKRLEGVVPAIWTRTPLAIATLVSDGLASLLPFSPPTNSKDASTRDYAFGRYYFAQQLWKEWERHAGLADEGEKNTMRSRFLKAALEYDLRGA